MIDVPVEDVVFGLNAIGVRVCLERADREDQLYVDSQGVALFRAAKLVSVDVKDETVHALLDELVRLDSEYEWKSDTTNNVINVFPRNSELDHEVASTSFEGNPYDAVGHVFSVAGIDSIAPAPRQGTPLPTVSIDTARGSVRRALNSIVASTDGLVWHVVPSVPGRARWVVFDHRPTPDTTQVDVVYDGVRQSSAPTDSSKKYVWIYRRSGDRIVLSVSASEHQRRKTPATENGKLR